MRKDLDPLMKERGIDAFVILANDGPNVYRDYMTGGAHAHCLVIKKQGEEAVLVANGMEVDEAAKSGLKVYNYNDFNYYQIMRENRDDMKKASAEGWRAIFENLDVKGRVAFYGINDVMSTWSLLTNLQQNLGDVIEIVEDVMPSIFDLARGTKDEDELTVLTEIGRKTGEAMQLTRHWIASHRVENDALVKEDGSPLTIGEVKSFVKTRLLERNLEDTGMIFAQGRDAGVPHSRGEANEGLKLGQSIVFDLFPKDTTSGYYHDMTRTWSIGYATAEVQKAYDLVMHTFSQSLEALTAGEPTSGLQDLVCDIFEEHGHPTPRTTPGTTEGYVHSLGHGLGLDVHEAPSMGNFGPKQVFEVGHVVTIEPGLYYPSKGWGIRVEDTVYVGKDGHLVNITDCPYDLVIEMKN